MSNAQDRDPPQPRWGRRLLIALTVIVLLIVGLLIGWGRTAQHNLDARIAEYGARTIPILPTDFDPKPMPDAENAARYYERAIHLKRVPPAQARWFEDFDARHSLTAADLSDARAVLAANADALKLAHDARDKPGVSWNLKFVSPVALNLNAPGSAASMMGDLRELSRFMALSVIVDDVDGKQNAAIDSLRDIEALSQAVDRQPLTLINHMGAVSIGTLGQSLAMDLSPGLKATTSREAVKKLIRCYRDERPVFDASRKVCDGERCVALDSLTTFASQKRMLAPLIAGDTLAVLDQIDAMQTAVTAATYPEAMKAIPTSMTTPRRRILHPWSSALSPAWGPIVKTQYRELFERRTAAVALAIATYRADHAGRTPKTLDELVPTYLDAVPRDPFATGHAAVLYRDGEVPLIYSVGIDGIDDHGALGPVRDDGRRDVWSGKDFVFEIKPLASPATAPATR